MTVGTGLIDELVQLAIPTRLFDPIDILFNAIAAILGVGLCAGVARLIRPRGAQAENPGATGSES